MTDPPPRTPPRLSWPHVVIVGLVLGAITALAVTGKDTATLVVLGTAILGGIGLVGGLQFALKDQTNGNQAQLLAMVREMAAQLALMQPPPAPPAEQPPPADHT